MRMTVNVIRRRRHTSILQRLDHDLLTFGIVRTDFVKLLNSQSENLSVLIGRESGRPELVNSSIVVAKYRIGGKESGAIGIIGPMRMDYAKMIPSLEYLAKSVGTLLSDLLDIES